MVPDQFDKKNYNKKYENSSLPSKYDPAVNGVTNK